MDIRLLTEVEKQSIGERQPLPERYLRLSDDEMDARITAAKRALGDRVVILGHHYQRDEVIKFADFTGDSLKLARAAALRPGSGQALRPGSGQALRPGSGQALRPGSGQATRHTAEFVVFCGVHFMAESADILRGPNQKVILPDLAAGCSMADMASEEQVEIAWRELAEMGVDTSAIVPVTYINSSAAIKAFVGRHGGVVCTSTNAAKVMTWAWERPLSSPGGDVKLLMLPDQHLGRNTGYALGVPLDRMAVWDPLEVGGGLTVEEARGAKLLLWKGHCSVHTRFTVAQIDAFRKKYPNGKVIAHPECTFDVVQAADVSGSTEKIIETVKASPKGSVWAVATEIHLVNRLAREVAPDRAVVTLDPFGCLCSTMFRVSPNHLLWVLEGLVSGEIHNQIVVPDETKRWAKLALDRMLDIH